MSNQHRIQSNAEQENAALLPQHTKIDMPDTRQTGPTPTCYRSYFQRKYLIWIVIITLLALVTIGMVIYI